MPIGGYISNIQNKDLRWRFNDIKHFTCKTYPCRYYDKFQGCPVFPIFVRIISIPCVNGNGKLSRTCALALHGTRFGSRLDSSFKKNYNSCFIPVEYFFLVALFLRFRPPTLFSWWKHHAQHFSITKSYSLRVAIFNTNCNLNCSSLFKNFDQVVKVIRTYHYFFKLFKTFISNGNFVSYYVNGSLTSLWEGSTYDPLEECWLLGWDPQKRRLNFKIFK